MGLKVAYVDVDIFANERFSSGLFKYIRAILLRFKQRGSDIRILSFAHYLSTQNKAEQKVGTSLKIVNNIPVEEYLLSKQPSQAVNIYRRRIHETLLQYKPDITFVNSTAVFLNEIHIALLEEMINSGTKVIMFVVDHLFPTYATHPKNLVDRYYNLMRKIEVVSCSPLIIEHLYKESKIKANLFLNLISISETISESGTHKYISMVNIHPIKGIAIFDKIVKKMPTKKFMIIKNWPDVPDYYPPTNVVLKDLYSDVKEFYQQTKILLVPSLHDEGQPTVITEAMLNGIPVIANSIGGIPEIESAPGVFLIHPPTIKGFTCRGTILYPNVDEEELEVVANCYVKIIETIDKDTNGWQRYSEGLKKQALMSCQKSEASFEKFFKKWST